MSTRGGDRPYKVVYSSRNHEEFDDQIPSRRPRRDFDYEDDYRQQAAYSRDYRDERIEIDRRPRMSDSRTSLPEAAGTTKTRYAVGRDKYAERYVKRSDAVVVEDRPADHGRYEYEVLHPQKRGDGTYVLDLGGGRSYDHEIDRDTRGYDRPQRPRYDDPLPPRRDDVIMYERSHGGDRDRAGRDVTYRDVQVMEEFEDDRYNRRGRASEVHAEDIPPPQRLRSAMRGRNNSPPELRRRASVGFFKDQISHHDASESRHERPGAEAHLAGRYLDRSGQFDDDTYVRRNRSRSRSRGRYGPQRSDPRLYEHDEYDDDRRTFTEETMRQYEYEDAQRPAYPPQRGHSRRRHHRHHRDDDDDHHSRYDTEVVKKTTKEYYR